MEKPRILRGLANVSFYANDLNAAGKWYSELLGIEPYFSVPGYIEFRIGDYQHELGIIDRIYAPAGSTDGPAGAVVYWHVDDLKASLENVLSMGATLYQPVTDRSGGKQTFVTVSVVDPFGNILGMMTNVHYMEILEQNKHS